MVGNEPSEAIGDDRSGGLTCLPAARGLLFRGEVNDDVCRHDDAPSVSVASTIARRSRMPMQFRRCRMLRIVRIGRGFRRSGLLQRFGLPRSGLTYPNE